MTFRNDKTKNENNPNNLTLFHNNFHAWSNIQYHRKYKT